jgi:hypothetical protein
MACNFNGAVIGRRSLPGDAGGSADAGGAVADAGVVGGGTTVSAGAGWEVVAVISGTTAGAVGSGTGGPGSV